MVITRATSTRDTMAPSELTPVARGVRDWARGVIGRTITTCGGCGGELVSGFGLCDECDFLRRRCHVEYSGYVRAANDASAEGRDDLAARFGTLAGDRYRDVVRLGEAYRPVETKQ